MTSPGWQTSAACGQENPANFERMTRDEGRVYGGFPHNVPRIRAALRLCAGCPVREACLRAAMAARETGVWGGHYLTNDERRRLQRSGEAA